MEPIKHEIFDFIIASTDEEDPDFARSIILLYQEECQKDLKALQTCISRGDYHQGAQIAHKWKGRAGQMGFMESMHCAAALHIAFKERQNVFSALNSLKDANGKLTFLLSTFRWLQQILKSS